jgi:hypothetical protein
MGILNRLGGYVDLRDLGDEKKRWSSSHLTKAYWKTYNPLSLSKAQSANNEHPNPGNGTVHQVRRISIPVVSASLDIIYEMSRHLARGKASLTELHIQSV